MRYRVWLAVVCVAALNGLSDTRTGWGQEKYGEVQVPVAAPVPVPAPAYGRNQKVERHEVRVGTGNPFGAVNPWDGMFQLAVRPESMREIQEAAKALHDAKDDDAKAEAQEKLTELLTKYFNEDMKNREKELGKIEERLKNLRALMQKRKAKQREIIDLQMKVLENEADGLGFFNNSPPGGPGMPGWGEFIEGKVNSAFGAPGGAIFVAPPQPPAGWQGASTSSGATYGGGGGGFGYKATTTPPPAADVPPAPPRPQKAPATPRRARPAAAPPAEAAEAEANAELLAEPVAEPVEPR